MLTKIWRDLSRMSAADRSLLMHMARKEATKAGAGKSFVSGQFIFNASPAYRDDELDVPVKCGTNYRCEAAFLT